MQRIGVKIPYTTMTKLFALPVACAALVMAQTDTASLSGLVKDPSEAAIAGAKVSLANKATGAQRFSETNAQGIYHFALLPPGDYEIAVEYTGFKKFQDSQVQIQVAQARQLNVRLEVGEPSEFVVVRGTTAPIDTQSVSQGTVIGQEKIVALPLNGRQFIQLSLLVPGANSGGRQVQQDTTGRFGAIGGISVSGGRTNNTSFLLDGAANIDPDYNALNYSPIVDDIAEFQVQTSMFNAEYGRASGGIVNVVTKSGTNQLHATAWEFIRNNKLDARPFNLVTSELPKYQRNQFGATVGGPIRKNRLFAQLAYEGLQLRQAGAALTSVTVPSLLQRQGIFSATPGGIYDPDTLQNGVRQRFANDAIPLNRIDPVALAGIRALPLPNVPGSSLFVNSNGITRQDNENYSGRLDYLVRQNLTLFGRYSLANEHATIPAAVPDRDQIARIRPQSAVLGATSLLRGNLVNETRFVFSRFRMLNGLPEPNYNVDGVVTHIPQFLAAGYLNGSNFGGAGQFTGTTGGGTVLVRDNTFQAYDNLSWQKGRHGLKFGGEIYSLQYNRYEAPNALGNYQYTAGFTTQTAKNDGTGDSLASLMLSLPAIANRTIGPDRIDGRQRTYAGYVQDDFRVRANLTLNLGVRYELTPPVFDAHQQISSIDYGNVPSPGAIFAEGRTGFYSPKLFVCGQSGYPRGCSYTDYNNFAPRVGAVWGVTPKTVVRGGGGLFYAGQDLNPLFRLAAGLPDNISQTLTSNNFIPQFRGLDVFGPAVVSPKTPPIQAAGIDLHQRTSYSLQLNFSVQREIRKDIAIEAGYIGNLGYKLEQNVQPNNALPGAGAVDPRRPYGSLTYAPGTGFPDYITVVGNTVPVGFLNYLPHSAQSNYHAGFVRFEKRFSKGLSVLSAYTFSKAITNAPQFRNAGGVNGNENSPPQNSYNLAGERGLASFDARNRWVSTVVYELPFGKGHNLLSDGLAGKIFGGFETSGILTLQSGFPFTVNLRGDTAGIGAGTGGIVIRPNAVAGVSAQLPRDQRSGDRFFNTSAFTLPAAFTLGNLGRNTVIGPGLVDMDFSLARNIQVREYLRIQFRAEFFNLFNHPNYNIVDRIINGPTFGRVLSQLDPRQLQFGIKIIF